MFRKPVHRIREIISPSLIERKVYFWSQGLLTRCSPALKPLMCVWRAWVCADAGIVLYVLCDYRESLVFFLERKAGNVVRTLKTWTDQSISKAVSSITAHGLRHCSHRINYIVSCLQGYFLCRLIVTKDFQIKKKTVGYTLNNDTDL